MNKDKSMEALEKCSRKIEAGFEKNNVYFMKNVNTEEKSITLYLPLLNYTFFLYSWCKYKPTEINVSLRGSDGVNLYDYVCAYQGVPFGAVRKHSGDAVSKKVLQDTQYIMEILQ